AYEFLSLSQIICTKRQKRSPWAAPLVYLSTYRISTPTGRMGHTLQLYIVHRMKALPKIPPLAGLGNFSRCGAFSLWRGRPRPRELLGGAALPALRFNVCD